MARVSNRLQQRRELCAANRLKRYQERTEMQKQREDDDVKIKNESVQKASMGRKAKREQKKERAEIRRRQLKIRRNTPKFDQYIICQKMEVKEKMPSTCCREFHRASSAPPESASTTTKNQYQERHDFKRSRSSITFSEYVKESMAKKKPELEMLMPKFDFDKAVKILRLRKEFHEQQRIERLRKAFLKRSKFGQIPMEPVRFTIKILKPVKLESC